MVIYFAATARNRPRATNIIAVAKVSVATRKQIWPLAVFNMRGSLRRFCRFCRFCRIHHSKVLFNAGRGLVEEPCPISPQSRRPSCYSLPKSKEPIFSAALRWIVCVTWLYRFMKSPGLRGQAAQQPLSEELLSEH